MTVGMIHSIGRLRKTASFPVRLMRSTYRLTTIAGPSVLQEIASRIQDFTKSHRYGRSATGGFFFSNSTISRSICAIVMMPTMLSACDW
jgi:hypothetical protein